MKFRILPVIAALALSGVALPLPASAQATMSGEKTVEVGGAPMYPSKTIVENAVNPKDHTTLVAAVKAAGLADTLSGAGPFTAFAPTNKAFEALPKGTEALPKGTVDSLLKPENKAKLTSVLTYHVVPGKVTAADLAAKVKAGNGKATLTTVQGGTLTVTDAGGGKLQIVDAEARREGEALL